MTFQDLHPRALAARASHAGAAVLDRVPLLLLMQGVLLLSAIVVSLWVHLVLVAPTDRTVALTVPGHEAARSQQLRWDDQVAGFATRLEVAFDLDRPVAEQFAPWILEASARQALPPEVLASVIETESDFRIDVTSSVGAVGPAQVRPRYWTGFCGAVDLHDPEENVYCAAQILAHFADRCGNLSCALESYNVGPRNARRSAYAGARERYLTKVTRSLDRLAVSNTLIL